ncbi:zf-HC2 domain-containing protein [Streptomyces dangxiongensis]|uniref:Zf-HC2 domain-containing protein n=1 Tax=Streptomyces dangxiongensis TaxID=1442032 RepID=A0A3G2JIU5_9ACTN|nr:zf-HC2 domain-containing protein [Streptomyces dangxiongensis]AYN41325.1 zf-HC2 domain-containing protein [Streptomyces dangxiongensis]
MTHPDRRPWHACDDLVSRYAEGTLPEPDAWSLEKHVEGCTECATRVSAAVRDTAAGAVLAQVRAAVLEPSPEQARAAMPAPAHVRAGGPSPAHVREGVPDPGRAWEAGAGAAREPRTGRRPGHTLPSRPLRSWSVPSGLPRLSRAGRAAGPGVPSRFLRLLWAAGPAVRGAWSPAVVVVAVGALLLSYGAGFPWARALLLAVSPLVPVAGVALSYGPHADPLHEVAAATPGGGLRLALTRTVAVLAVSLPLLTLTGLLLPASGAPAAAAWLLPGLALALATLGLASFTGCRVAAGVTGGGWLLAVLAPLAAAPGGAVTARLAGQLSRCLDGAAAQSGWAAGAALSAVLLLARRPVFDRPLRP